MGIPLISLGLAQSMQEVDALIATVDRDGSQAIDFTEFETMLVTGTAGPIRELLTTIQSGELGDPSITSVRSLLTAARRRIICNTLHGYGRSGTSQHLQKTVTRQDKKDRNTIKELQKIQNAANAAKGAAELKSAIQQQTTLVRTLKKAKGAWKLEVIKLKKMRKEFLLCAGNMKQQQQHNNAAEKQRTTKRRSLSTTVNEENIDVYRTDLDEKMRREVYQIYESDPTSKWLPSLG